MNKDFSGGCSCGAVRYRFGLRPMMTHCCHCRDCQKQTGSAFVINALVETDEIEVTGALECVAMPSPSGRGHDIYRCPACQVAVWSDYGKRPFLRFVRVGTLDDPDAVAPDVHIFTRSKVPWVRLPEGVPACDIFYDMMIFWPPEALERRRVMLERGATAG